MVFHQKLKYKTDAHMAAKLATKQHIDSMCKLIQASSTQQVLREINDYVKQKTEKLNLDKDSNVSDLGVFKWRG